jgi:bifunctional non-homologous end joining protein LigD
VARTRALPLLKRKAALQNGLKRTERIVYCQHVGENGEKLFQAADQLGLEGVIGKRADSVGVGFLYI